VAAFEHFTGEPGRRGEASFRFRCASCGEYIADRGPRPGHPEDSERGHAAGCVRLAADIAAWRAEGRPVALTITYEMIRSTGVRPAAYGDGGWRVSGPAGLRARLWLSAKPG
jgi:hypothetical protein